jgi:hypothetical protein
MVGKTIQNGVNQSDKPIGINFRRKNQLSGDVVWSVFEKVIQSNAQFNALDRLVIMWGLVVSKQISVLVHLKRSIIEVKAAENCLAHALS